MHVWDLSTVHLFFKFICLSSGMIHVGPQHASETCTRIYSMFKCCKIAFTALERFSNSSLGVCLWNANTHTQRRRSFHSVSTPWCDGKSWSDHYQLWLSSFPSLHLCDSQWNLVCSNLDFAAGKHLDGSLTKTHTHSSVYSFLGYLIMFCIIFLKSVPTQGSQWYMIESLWPSLYLILAWLPCSHCLFLAPGCFLKSEMWMYISHILQLTFRQLNEIRCHKLEVQNLALRTFVGCMIKTASLASVW